MTRCAKLLDYSGAADRGKAMLSSAKASTAPRRIGDRLWRPRIEEFPRPNPGQEIVSDICTSPLG
jgi:hypothetical protein